MIESIPEFCRRIGEHNFSMTDYLLQRAALPLSHRAHLVLLP